MLFSQIFIDSEGREEGGESRGKERHCRQRGRFAGVDRGKHDDFTFLQTAFRTCSVTMNLFLSPSEPASQ